MSRAKHQHHLGRRAIGRVAGAAVVLVALAQGACEQRHARQHAAAVAQAQAPAPATAACCPPPSSTDPPAHDTPGEVAPDHADPMAPPTVTSSTSDGTLPAINTFCPIMPQRAIEGRVHEALSRSFEGQTVGLCCEECVLAWDSLDDQERRERLARVMPER